VGVGLGPLPSALGAHLSEPPERVGNKGLPTGVSIASVGSLTVRSSSWRVCIHILARVAHMSCPPVLKGIEVRRERRDSYTRHSQPDEKR